MTLYIYTAPPCKKCVQWNMNHPEYNAETEGIGMKLVRLATGVNECPDCGRYRPLEEDEHETN